MPTSDDYAAWAAGAANAIAAATQGNPSQTTTNQFGTFDPRLYEYTDLERDSTAGMSLDMINQIYGQAFGGGGGGGGYGHISGGGASSGGGAASAKASLIDTGDEIYQLLAPRDWLQGMAARSGEYLRGQADQDVAAMAESAVNSGMDSGSPAFMWMAQQRRQKANEALANQIRDAELGWTLPAADRRHGAFGQNAQLGTNVNMQNAQLQEAARARAMQASIANAQMRMSASQANAGMDLQRQSMLWGMMQDVIRPSDHLQALNAGSRSESDDGVPWWQSALAAGGHAYQQYRQNMNRGGGGYQAGDPYDPSGFGSPYADLGDYNPNNDIGDYSPSPYANPQVDYSERNNFGFGNEVPSWGDAW